MVPLKLGCTRMSVRETMSPTWRAKPYLSSVGPEEVAGVSADAGVVGVAGAVAVESGAVSKGEDAELEEDEGDEGADAAAWQSADSLMRHGMHRRL